MAKKEPRMSVEVITALLIKELKTLERTTEKIQELQKGGMKVDEQPLESFNTEFRLTMQDYEKIGKRKLQLPKWMMVAFFILAFVAATGTGAAVYYLKEKNRWEELAHQWREQAIELGYQSTKEN